MAELARELHLSLSSSDSEGVPEMASGATAVSSKWLPKANARFLRPVGVLAVGAALGTGSCMLTRQGRLRMPVDPLVPQSKSIKFTELPAELPKFPVAFPVPPNNECGAAICAEGDLCCPGGPGYGYSCGTSQAECCQGFLFDDAGQRSQVSVAIVCGEQDVCCNNDQGDPYCCASGNSCSNNVCVAGGGQCFSGDASVTVPERGLVRLAHVRIGDSVLVETASADIAYQKIEGFLHAASTEATSHVTISHETGELRLSETHLVYLITPSGEKMEAAAATVHTGDYLSIVAFDAEATTTSRVLSVWRSSHASGMYAPITASGKVIVDGVVSSSFALPNLAFAMSHGPMHVALYLSRAIRMLLGASIFSDKGPHGMVQGAPAALPPSFTAAAK
eukprot:TRINITY_DN9769_c0_g1_i2.p1 TRINITY_DN9769_c0_g1~~TRINITY_DN9769_c0_g1_i2.p1  ORF type:complete len:410 (-),score=54.55 TRINITY_DN9769_c0_g1_i2:270-1445(-)